jgi:hypothetical protein
MIIFHREKLITTQKFHKYEKSLFEKKKPDKKSIFFIISFNSTVISCYRSFSF